MDTHARSVFLILVICCMRSFITGNVTGFLQVLAAASFHECYRLTRGTLGRINILYCLVWLLNPYLYIPWVISWELGTSMRSTSKWIISKDGRSKTKISEHSMLIPDYVKNHNIWNIALDYTINVIGTSLEPEYIGNVHPTDPIMDENMAVESLSQVVKESTEAWSVYTYMMALCAVMFMTATAGTTGFSIGSAIAICIIKAKPKESQKDSLPLEDIKVSRAEKLPLSDGIYRLSARTFGWKNHVGVGYVKNGILTTRYHVTNNNFLEIEGEYYRSTFSNKTKDAIAYGGIPRIDTVYNYEELVVALAGPRTNYIVCYKTRSVVDGDGNLIFCGNRSIPGCSGSPVFRLATDSVVAQDGSRSNETHYNLVGTIGWFYDKKITDGNGYEDERKAFEVVPNTPTTSEYHARFIPGNITQIFKHPGSGKTRTIAKDLIVDGIAKYGKVYFTGPTRVVCQEAYNALSDVFQNQVGLCTSSATAIERGSYHRPITIMAHATALNMLAKGSAEVMKKGLWIMDEAHFLDTKTLVLKDYLRHLIRNEHRGALVELTATGYNILSQQYELQDGSNTEINDVIMTERDMAKDIIANCKDKKIMVFVTAQMSKNRDNMTVTQNLAKEIESRGGYYVILSREKFNQNYDKARNMQKGVILTTDISECGANLHPEIVYDFQRTSKVTIQGKVCDLESKTIDKGQRVQRRGRVGRRTDMEATYVSPGYDLPTMDVSRVEQHERKYIASRLQIDILDPTVSETHLSDLELTSAQIAVWASSGEGGATSLRMIAMTTDANGRVLPPEQINHRIKEWAESDYSFVKVNDNSVYCDWWDVRDKKHLIVFLERMGKLRPTPNQNNRNNRSITDLVSKMFYNTKPMVHHGMVRDCANQQEDDEQEYFPQEELQQDNYEGLE